MSAANVEFLDIAGNPVQPGEKPQRFTFRCVNGNRDKCSPNYPDVTCASLLIANSGHGIPRDGQNQNGGRAQWDWDGNREAPTFTPSINCEGNCGWHGYIRNGRCVSVSGVDEP